MRLAVSTVRSTAVKHAIVISARETRFNYSERRTYVGPITRGCLVTPCTDAAICRRRWMTASHGLSRVCTVPVGAPILGRMSPPGEDPIRPGPRSLFPLDMGAVVPGEVVEVL